jgi:hypothetical protein
MQLGQESPLMNKKGLMPLELHVINGSETRA